MILNVTFLALAGIFGGRLSQVSSAPINFAPGIEVPINLPNAGLATVVIEDSSGNRVRNLISETPLPPERRS